MGFQDLKPIAAIDGLVLIEPWRNLRKAIRAQESAYTRIKASRIVAPRVRECALRGGRTRVPLRLGPKVHARFQRYRCRFAAIPRGMKYVRFANFVVENRVGECVLDGGQD